MCLLVVNIVCSSNPKKESCKISLTKLGLSLPVYVRMYFQHSGAKIRVFEENTGIIKFCLFYSAAGHECSIVFTCLCGSSSVLCVLLVMDMSWTLLDLAVLRENMWKFAHVLCFFGSQTLQFWRNARLLSRVFGFDDWMIKATQN